MKTAVIEIEGIAPISFSAQYTVAEREGENKGDYDMRTWRERCHVGKDDDRVFMPGKALAKGLVATAMQLGDKVPGRGAKRWGSVFKVGLLCPGELYIMTPAPTTVVPSSQAPSGPQKVDVLKSTIDFVDVYCDATPGKPGGGRVWRRFPVVMNWSTTATIMVVNDLITDRVLKRHVEMCGLINGLGRHRPGQGGDLGRFKLIDFMWHDEAKDKAA